MPTTPPTTTGSAAPSERGTGREGSARDGQGHSRGDRLRGGEPRERAEGGLGGRLLAHRSRRGAAAGARGERRRLCRRNRPAPLAVAGHEHRHGVRLFHKGTELSIIPPWSFSFFRIEAVSLIPQRHRPDCFPT